MKIKMPESVRIPAFCAYHWTRGILFPLFSAKNLSDITAAEGQDFISANNPGDNAVGVALPQLTRSQIGADNHRFSRIHPGIDHIVDTGGDKLSRELRAQIIKYK